jgi:hypothetical protein
MNCEEFQSHLQDLVESGLDSAVGPLHEHLAECLRCSRELADLMECRRLIAGLPEIDPPAGLTARVMAGVRGETRRKTPISRLRVLTTRIPLQAAAVVLIGIISIFVYQREQHNPPSVAPPERSAADQRAPASEPAAPGAAVSGHDTPEPGARVESVSPRRRRTGSVEPKPRATPAPSAPSVEEPREFRRTSPLRAQGIVATMGPAAPAALRDRGFRPFTGARGFPNLGEPVADYELIVRRRSGTEAPGEANAREASEETSPASQPRLHSSSAVDIQWYVIAQDRYEHFKKEVAARAVIESENAIGATDRQGSFRADGPYYVKVLVLAPLEP